MLSLTFEESRARAALLRPTSYDVTLDLAADTETYTSRTVLRLTSGAGETFCDLKPLRLDRVTLDGTDVDVDRLSEGRLPLRLTEGEHELVVEALMGFRHDGEGLHRAHDPADGEDYVYGMSFMDAAPSVFACFDQPDLKAPYTLHVTTPDHWVVRANGRAEQVQPGRWEMATTEPLSTYFVTLVAGPWHVVEEEYDGLTLGLSARRSLGDALDRNAPELLSLTRSCLDAFHGLFGVRYPFGDYHQAFVPEFNAGAMENPGCVTFRDSLVFTSTVTRSAHLYRATTIAHEMAHQWFGNIVTPAWWDDLWLNESFAEYLGNRVTAEATPYVDALRHNTVTRRNWGLDADSRPTTHPVAGSPEVDAMAALQDFDGISYAKGSALLRQLATRLGDEVFVGGTVALMEQHRFGNARLADLVRCWEEAGAGDLDGWVQDWLRTSDVDRLRLDRESGEVVRTAPPGQSVRREHATELAVWDEPSQTWGRVPLLVSGDRTHVEVGAAPVLLDPAGLAWADLVPDALTAAALPRLLPLTAEPERTAVWVQLRTGVRRAEIDPALALEMVCAGIPGEEADPSVASIGGWATGTLLRVVIDPEHARERLHHAFDLRADSAGDDGLRLAAYQVVVATSTDVEALHAVLGGAVPSGVELDRELRWRVVRRLAALGALDRAELDERLERDPDARSRIDHAYCAAALPTREAKAWAWERFTGEVEVPNHELSATGAGLWQAGQEELLAPYVERYHAEVAATASVRSGWLLADAAEDFYPSVPLRAETVAATLALCQDPSLDPTLRRKLLDSADDLDRLVQVRHRFCGHAGVGVEGRG